MLATRAAKSKWLPSAQIKTESAAVLRRITAAALLLHNKTAGGVNSGISADIQETPLCEFLS